MTSNADAPLARLPDEQLLYAWREGDKQAGTELVSRYFDLLIRFFHNKVANPEDAADLVSETMLACTRAKGRIADGRSFRSYLFAVAMNALRSYLRKRIKRQRELDDFSEICIADTEKDDTPIKRLLRDQEARLLARALRRIPLDQQIVLELVFFESMSAPRIAELLSIPEPTVYSRQRRGKQHLQRVLTELSTDPTLVESTMTGLQTWAAQIRAQISDARA